MFEESLSDELTGSKLECVFRWRSSKHLVEASRVKTVHSGVRGTRTAPICLCLVWTPVSSECISVCDGSVRLQVFEDGSKKHHRRSIMWSWADTDLLEGVLWICSKADQQLLVFASDPWLVRYRECVRIRTFRITAGITTGDGAQLTWIWQPEDRRQPPRPTEIS